MTGLRAVPWGRQDRPFGGAVAWVLPNPSGRNRAFSQDGLVTVYRALRRSAERRFSPTDSAVDRGEPAPPGG